MKSRFGWAFPEADDFMINQISEDGGYQSSHLLAAMAYVTDWSCAGDAGAHVGTWSRQLSSRFERVIAFEPSEDTHEALVANMAAFGCANVDVRRCALGAVPGTVKMAPLEERAAALKNTGARFVQDGTEIQRITVDSLNLPTLGFLKMDVEGSEPLVLMGARATLTRCKPIVLFENKGLCRRFGFKPTACQDILAAIGYRELEVTGCDRIWGKK